MKQHTDPEAMWQGLAAFFLSMAVPCGLCWHYLNQRGEPLIPTAQKGTLLMNAVTLLHEQLQQAHAFLNTIMHDVTPEQAHWCPPGTANPLGATYVHAIASEDTAIQMILQGGAPLFASTWVGKTGVSDIQPLSSFEWARRVQVDLAGMAPYAAAVHAAAEAYVATLTDDDLARPIDMSQFGLGMQTVGSLLNRLVLGHIDNMSGEISCLKGLQGGQGYPF